MPAFKNFLAECFRTKLRSRRVVHVAEIKTSWWNRSSRRS